MAEQCCGTCRSYEPDTSVDKAADYGWCGWTDERDVPFHLEEGCWEVAATDGRRCPCWRIKETDHE